MMGLTGESDGPISSSAVGEVTGNGTKGITEKFAGACRNADGRRGRAKRTHELPVDASAALVGDVGEQVDAAHDQHEGKGRRGRRDGCVHGWRSISGRMARLRTGRRELTCNIGGARAIAA